MTSGKIDAAKTYFKNVFSEEFWFLIPEYQRSYVWDTDNITELVEDLTYACDNKPENDYFLGSLVLKRTETEEFPEYEVLDGQQRLTTFLIMMAVARDLVSNDKSKSTIHEKIYQEEDPLESIPERTRVTYRIRDKVEDFIRDYLIVKDGTLKFDELQELVKSDNVSLSNMANAVLILHELLQEKNNLFDYIKFVFNNALFIYVSTSNTEDAFRMFTILNDRGIPLTSADILKSQNIGELSNETEIKKYALLWEEIEGKHGDRFDRFLQFIRTILVKDKARAGLLDEFNEKVYKPGLLARGKETVEFISRYDEIYGKMIEFEDYNLDNEFKNLITIMKIGFRSEDWIPPLLAYFRKFKYYRLTEFLKLLEYKFSGDWICGISPTLRLDAMNVILKEIDNNDIADNLLNNNSIFQIDKNELRKQLCGDVYTKTYVRHLLLKLEYLNNDNTVHYSNYKSISVEHILPQNPGNGSNWLKTFTDEEKVNWTNKLANLVLISKRKNSSLSNLDFKDKKEKYLKGRIDAFKSNKIFVEQNSDWNPMILAARQENLVDRLVQNV